MLIRREMFYIVEHEVTLNQIFSAASVLVVFLILK